MCHKVPSLLNVWTTIFESQRSTDRSKSNSHLPSPLMHRTLDERHYGGYKGNWHPQYRISLKPNCQVSTNVWTQMGRLNPGIEKQKKERKNRDDRKVVEKGKTWMTKMKKTFEISRRKNPAHQKKKKKFRLRPYLTRQAQKTILPFKLNWRMSSADLQLTISGNFKVLL